MDALKTALLIIDVQRGLFEESPRPYEADEVIKNINHVIGKARIAGIPVVFIQHEQDKGLLEYGCEGWCLQTDLETDNADFRVRKRTPDSFLRTDLEKILHFNGINNLIICGYASEFCVDTTVRRAAALGYSVQLVADAHTTHDKKHALAKQIREHHNITLQSITSFGPRVTAVMAVGLTIEG